MTKDDNETEKFRVLIVEDDDLTREAIAAALRWAGFLCTEAGDAERARYIILKAKPDLVVLDLGLPDANGLELLRELLEEHELPVVVCTGRDETVDRLRGLGLGADDYVTKPFSPRELALRVRSVLRRTHAAPAATILRFGEVVVNMTERTVTVAEESVALTAREFALLAYLAARPRTVVTRQELLEAVWGEAAKSRSESTVTEHMRRLRAKLKDHPTSPRHLRAVRGMGYRLIP